MSRVSQMSTRASELALKWRRIDWRSDINQRRNRHYALAHRPAVPARYASEFATMLTEKHTNNITGATYVQMMPHTTAVNTGLFWTAGG